jgi:hypothetical protein
MQDGAPTHYTSDVRDWLDEIFPARWIARWGAIDWPDRSPDLSPGDFSLWGIAKISCKKASFETYPIWIDQSFQPFQHQILICTRELVNQCPKDFKGTSMVMDINLNIGIKLLYNLSLYLLLSI